MIGGNRRYIDALQQIVYQYNSSKHRATGETPFILYRGHDPRSGSNNECMFNVMSIKARYLQYIEGFRNEYDKKYRVQDVLCGDRVLVAKEFRSRVSTREAALESFYETGVYIVRGVYDTFVIVEDQDGNESQFHIRRIKKI